MGLFERLGVPSPDECLGIVGLSLALFGLTVGVVWLLLLDGEFYAWALVVASLFVGWASFLYCIVWGESTPTGDVWEG